MAATDIERLIVSLEARTKAFENALAKANGTANQRANAIERRFKAMNRNVQDSFTVAATAAARAFALIGGAAGAKELTDAGTRINNALKVAGLSGQELETVYQSLFQAATKNATPIEALVQLYGRLSLVQKELGVSSQQIVGFAGNIALALRVGGVSAEQASGALLGLSQGLGNGKVTAEDFNQVLEGAPTILLAAAAGIQEAGGSVSKLRQLMLDGQLSSKAFFDGFQAGAPILEEKVAGAVLTIDQRLTNLNTALIDAAREFNTSAKAGETFGSAIDQVAGFVNSIQFDSLISQIQSVIAAMNSGIATVNSFAAAYARLSGYDGIGRDIVNMLPGDGASKSLLGGALTVTSTAGITDRINQAFEGQIENAGKLTAEAVRNSVLGGVDARPVTTTNKAGRVPAAPSPISLNDPKYAVPASSSKGGKKSKGGGGGGKGANEYQREIEQIKERTAAVQAETAAMVQLNPLIDDFGYSVEFARTKQDLLTAAQQAGVAITPQVQASIEAMAKGYAEASAAADKLQATQAKAKEQAEFFAQTAYDSFSELIPQIETGNKALDKFLNTLIEAVAQSALLGKGPLAGIGGGGGLFGGLFKIFGFATGGIASGGKPMKTFAGGGISRSAAVFGEAGPEAAVPLPDGRRIPVDLRMPTRQGGQSGGTHVTFGVAADNNGNLLPFVQSVSDERVQKAAPRIVSAASQNVVPTMAKHQATKAGAEWR